MEQLRSPGRPLAVGHYLPASPLVPAPKPVPVANVIRSSSYETTREQPYNHRHAGLQSPTAELQSRSRAHGWSRVAGLFGDWYTELGAIALLLLTFSGLVAVLRNYQEQPIPRWPLGLSLNTALSVFGVFFRVPLLYIAAEGLGQLKWSWVRRQRPLSDLRRYDDASRGPWGALMLLWVARWRHVAAFLGALLTVLAIALEPFTQAVVSYYGCQTIITGADASVSRINSFYYNAQEEVAIADSVRVRLASGLSNAAAILPHSNCTSERCTFAEPYHSIGLCSECADVTEQVQTTCTDGDRTSGVCNYTLTVTRTDDGYQLNTTASYAKLPVDPGKTKSVTSDWTYLAATKYWDQVSENGSTLPGETYETGTVDLVASRPILGCRCSVYYCVRTYTATIQAGLLHEDLHSTSKNWSSYTKEAPVMGTVKVDCLSPAVQSHLLSHQYTSPDTVWMSWNGTYLNRTEQKEGISSSSTPAIPAECAYQLLMMNDVLLPISSESFTSSLEGSLIGQSSRYNDERNPESASTMLQLYNDGQITIQSVQESFNNFTSTVTNFLRTVPVPIPPVLEMYDTDMRPKPYINTNVRSDATGWNQAVKGIASAATTCIEVRWSWLTVPAMLIIGLILFLIMVVIQTAGLKGPAIWKSSLEALIWHGLDGPAEEEAALLETRPAMEKRAKEINIKLGRTDRGWKLIQDY